MHLLSHEVMLDFGLREYSRPDLGRFPAKRAASASERGCREADLLQHPSHPHPEGFGSEAEPQTLF